MNDLNITTLAQLQDYANGNILELPPFSEGQPLVARLRRPSMMALVRNGKIPNELLTSANELFAEGVSQAFDPENKEALNEMFVLLDTMCEASFVEPSYQEIKDAGIELTDEQKIFVCNYAQAGVRALDSFRPEQADSADNRSCEVVQMPTESVDGDR